MLVHLNPTYTTHGCNGDLIQHLLTEFFNILCQNISASRRLDVLDV